MKHVSHKDKKAFCADLKSIYRAATGAEAYRQMEAVRAVWEKKHPGSMNRRVDTASEKLGYGYGELSIMYPGRLTGR